MKNAIILAALMCGACADITVQQTRDTTADQLSLDVTDNYQAVYRRMVGPMRQCFQQPAIVAVSVEQRVQADLYPDLGSGEISVLWLHPATTKAVIVVDIARTATGTRVSAGFNGGFKTYRPQIEAWASGREASCS